MKKAILSLILTLSLFFGFCPTTANAQSENIIKSYTVFYNDGSYSIITLIEYVSPISATEKSGSKVYHHYNSSSEIVWEYSINGVFSYNGSSSSCTSVSDSYYIYNNNWHMDNHSCWKSGNTAYGNVTMKYKVLGITLDTISTSLTLSCSPSGVLS